MLCKRAALLLVANANTLAVVAFVNTRSFLNNDEPKGISAILVILQTIFALFKGRSFTILLCATIFTLYFFFSFFHAKYLHYFKSVKLKKLRETKKKNIRQQV